MWGASSLPVRRMTIARRAASARVASVEVAALTERVWLRPAPSSRRRAGSSLTGVARCSSAARVSPSQEVRANVWRAHAAAVVRPAPASAAACASLNRPPPAERTVSPVRFRREETPSVPRGPVECGAQQEPGTARRRIDVSSRALNRAAWGVSSVRLLQARTRERSVLAPARSTEAAVTSRLTCPSSPPSLNPSPSGKASRSACR